MVEPSAAYHAALADSTRVAAAGKSFTGKFLRPHAPFVKEIVDRLGCRTALDYGCGRGEQYSWVMPKHGVTLEQWWGVTVAKYDPAFPQFAEEPKGRFDLVICTHTLGAIPRPDLRWVIDRLHALAARAIYVSERIGEARKELGDNALRPSQWSAQDWMDVLPRRDDVEITLATRTIENGHKITRHHRFADGAWSAVVWPAHVRPLNHEWA